MMNNYKCWISFGVECDLPGLNITHIGICCSGKATAFHLRMANHQLQHDKITMAGCQLPCGAVQGVMHSEDGSLESHRAAFVERAHKALDAVLQRVPFDSVADEMSVRFLRQRLPHPDDSQVASIVLPRIQDFFR